MVTSPLAITPLPLSPLVTNLLTPLPPPPGDVIFERPLFVPETFVLIFARRNFRADLFCAPSIKLQNSVLVFAHLRANGWPKEHFCTAFFKVLSLKIFARINFRAPRHMCHKTSKIWY